MLLALDTCLASCSAAVYEPGSARIVASRRALMERGQAEAIAPMVRDVMAEANVDFDALNAIAVTIGPGTFTGVRIGLALAQGLALARQTSLIGISSLLATAAPALGAATDVVVCHAAGATGMVYTQRFDAAGVAATDIQLLRPDDVLVQPGDILLGTGAHLLAERGLRKPAYDLPDAPLFAGHAATLPRSHHSDVLPLYVREAHVTAPALRQRVGATVLVGRVGADQSPVLAALHAASFEAGWGTQAISDMLASTGTIALLARTGEAAAGFLMVQAIGGEAEVLTLATGPSLRRRGVARQMLHSAFRHLGALNVQHLFLEVAADNDAALALYEACGFLRVGKRAGYYARPTGAVDAVLMRRPVP